MSKSLREKKMSSLITASSAVTSANNMLNSVQQAMRVPRNIHSFHRKVVRSVKTSGSKLNMVIIAGSIMILLLLYVILKTKETLFVKWNGPVQNRQSFSEIIRAGADTFIRKMADDAPQNVSTPAPPTQLNALAVTLSDKLMSGEEKVRSVVQYLMAAEFPSCRPTWLRNPVTDRTLQLDCYNESLGLAIEFDGYRKLPYLGVAAVKQWVHSFTHPYRKRIFVSHTRSIMVDGVHFCIPSVPQKSRVKFCCHSMSPE